MTTEIERATLREKEAVNRNKANKYRKCYIGQKVTSVPCDEDGMLSRLTLRLKVGIRSTLLSLARVTMYLRTLSCHLHSLSIVQDRFVHNRLYQVYHGLCNLRRRERGKQKILRSLQSSPDLRKNRSQLLEYSIVCMAISQWATLPRFRLQPRESDAA